MEAHCHEAALSAPRQASVRVMRRPRVLRTLFTAPLARLGKEELLSLFDLFCRFPVPLSV
jgi:hypothetical protein